jgi:hypothetical protein
VGAELVPLWTRALNPIRPFAPAGQNAQQGLRGALSVSATGQVAVVAGGLLWVIDGVSGIPSHAFLAADSVRLNSQDALYFDSPGHVAFTPDAGGVWLRANGMPAFVDLEAIDRRRGPLVRYSWALQADSDESWEAPAQSVARDGTLVWLSSGGVARALGQNGTVRWESSVYGGTPRLDSNEFVFWSAANPARALALQDAREVWRPQVLSGWTDSVLTNSEDAPTRSVIPVRHTENFKPVLSLHRLDGTVAAIAHGSDGGLPLFPDATAQSVGELLVSDQERLASFDQATGELRWLVRLPSALGTDLVPAERSGKVFAATKDCRLLALDSDGRIVNSHRMKGFPTGDLMKLRNGILYVLTQLPMPVSSARLFPGDVTSARPDGSVPRIADYDCFRSVRTQCGPPIDGELGYLYLLYAFAVE